MFNQKKISVCLNTYNHKRYIKDAIEGVLRQKHTYDWEFIIADDFSTDGTREIIAEYKNLYPDLIRIIHRTKNIGAARNGHELLTSSQSEYIAYLEGDDYWIDDKKLQKQIDFLDANPNYSLTWTDVDFHYDKEDTIVKAVFHNEIIPIYTKINSVLLNKPFFAPSTWVFRTNLKASKVLYDYCDGTFPFILDVICESNIKYIPCVTARYRILEESASNSNSILRRYQFLLGVHKIQKIYSEKLLMPKSIKDEIKFSHSLQALPYVILVESQDSINELTQYLLTSGRNIGFKTHVLIFMSKYRLGIYFVNIIYSSKRIKNNISTTIKFIKKIIK